MSSKQMYRSFTKKAFTGASNYYKYVGPRECKTLSALMYLLPNYWQGKLG